MSLVVLFIALFVAIAVAQVVVVLALYKVVTFMDHKRSRAADKRSRAADAAAAELTGQVTR